MPKYNTIIKKISKLEATQHKLICDLYLAYYSGSNAEQVLADLANKTEILMVYYDTTLIGFSTVQLYSYRWKGQNIMVVYSGDTIVSHEHWGQQNLAFGWIQRMGKLQAEHPEMPIYWFLIVKGFRTYRYLSAFSKSFFPHWSIDRTDLKALADTLAQGKFADAYNAQSGVVEFASSRGHLKSEYARPSAREKAKQSVRFFLKKNPEYTRGNELVCICELKPDNLKPLARRIFLKGFRHE